MRKMKFMSVVVMLSLTACGGKEFSGRGEDLSTQVESGVGAGEIPFSEPSTREEVLAALQSAGSATIQAAFAKLNMSIEALIPPGGDPRFPEGQTPPVGDPRFPQGQIPPNGDGGPYEGLNGCFPVPHPGGFLGVNPPSPRPGESNVGESLESSSTCPSPADVVPPMLSAIEQGRQNLAQIQHLVALIVELERVIAELERLNLTDIASDIQQLVQAQIMVLQALLQAVLPPEPPRAG